MCVINSMCSDKIKCLRSLSNSSHNLINAWKCPGSKGQKPVNNQSIKQTTKTTKSNKIQPYQYFVFTAVVLTTYIIRLEVSKLTCQLSLNEDDLTMNKK